jgi:hypothetical protein
MGRLDEIKRRYPGGDEVEVMDGDRVVFTAYALDARDTVRTTAAQ